VTLHQKLSMNLACSLDISSGQYRDLVQLMLAIGGATRWCFTGHQAALVCCACPLAKDEQERGAIAGYTSLQATTFVHTGGHMAPRRQPYMQSSEQMWAQSQGMHMPGGKPSGHMAMQAGMPMHMSGGYMIPGMMPGMMPGMPMMGPGKLLTHHFVALQVVTHQACMCSIPGGVDCSHSCLKHEARHGSNQESWLPLYRIS